MVVKNLSKLALVLSLIASTMAPVHQAQALVFHRLGFQTTAWVSFSIIGVATSTLPIGVGIKAMSEAENIKDFTVRDFTRAADSVGFYALGLAVIAAVVLDENGGFKSLNYVTSESAAKIGLTADEMTSLNTQLNRANIVMEFLNQKAIEEGTTTASLQAEYVRLSQEYKLTAQTKSALAKISAVILKAAKG